MHDETDFLRALLANPADDTLRVVYADWLDERGDDESKDKARFLRVTVRLMGPIQRVGWRHARRRELHELAQELPPEWLAVVSRLRVENCPQAQTLPHIRFNAVCDRRWDELTATDEPTARHCERCKENVRYCDTIEGARDRAWRGECVAVGLGVVRYGCDLEPAVGGGGTI